MIINVVYFNIQSLLERNHVKYAYINVQIYTFLNIIGKDDTDLILFLLLLLLLLLQVGGYNSQGGGHRQ